MIGKTLAHYEITALLGKGGMGEVYRAHDTKLGRDVALKLLTGMGNQSSERLARFQQEARTIAALNHPNIVTLFAVEEADGTPFLTMELVEGQSLTERIRNDGLRLDELLEYAVPIADAVSTAHKQGITHRDLKPDNVMVDNEGRVKVLDFGLAKLFEEPEEELPQDSRTIAVHRTQEGRILGTAAYMSPEQAEGKSVDSRSDVFSLGIVLYEMATGRQPFAGETAISTISSIMKEQPPSALEINRSLPRQLGRILDRCLTKDPERRYQSALELRNELEVLDRESKSGELEAWTPPTEGKARRSSGNKPFAWIAALALVGLAAFFAGRAVTGPAESKDLVFSSFELLTSDGNRANSPSVAPAGGLFAYTADSGEDRDVFLQRRGGQRPINLTEDSGFNNANPSISPDGERIVFESTRQGRGIFVMGTTGEGVRRVIDEGHHPAWSPDGQTIAYSTANWFTASARDDEGVLRIVDLEGSTPRTITAETRDAAQPSFSPDGQRLVFWGVASQSGQRDIWSIRTDGTDLLQLTDDAAVDWSPRYDPEGRFVYYLSNRGGTNNLWRVAVDPGSGEAKGVPRPVPLGSSQVASFDLAREGTEVLYSSIDYSVQAYRVDLPGAVGAPVVPRAITRGSVRLSNPRLSPDDQWITSSNGSDRGNQDIFVVRVDGSGLNRITNDSFRDRGPNWHPDGEHIVFYSDRSGAYEIWIMRPDGSGLRQLSNLQSEGLDSQWFPHYSPDGSRLFTMNEEGTYVYEVDPATGTLQNMKTITPPEGEYFYPTSWHPTRASIVGWVGDLPSRNTHGGWVHDLETGEWTQIVERVEGDGWLASFVYSRDGGTLYARTIESIVALDLSTIPYTNLTDPPVEILVEGLTSGGSLSMAQSGEFLLAEQSDFSSEIWVAGVE